jgi:hypothetical protein
VSDQPQEQPREPWSYSGEIWTDADSQAVVVLPFFVRAHRAGFEYELTPLGSSAAARVVEEVAEGRFKVATDQPHVKVAWRVTPLKQKPS